jgi:biotin-dependent carboxylase-like uncharacterized protein
MSACLRVLDPGLSTTIQDLGRRGFQRYGVPTSGALDAWSLQAANFLVGNKPESGVLEILYCGPTLMVEADSIRIAFAGGDARLQIFSDSTASTVRNAKPFQSIYLHRGQIVRVGSINRSSTLYLAVEGGFDVPRVLGSVSTFARGSLGGLDGRALRKGDALPLVRHHAPRRAEQCLPHGLPRSNAPIRIMPGPQADYFGPTALRDLCEEEYTIESGSDRTALRLAGPSISHTRGHDIISDALAAGSIQIPGSRKPMILLADRPTTGGYPKIATVISADLPALGRAPIGSRISFSLVTEEQAITARRQLLAATAELQSSLAPLDICHDPILSRLLNDNLVSGVYDACA